MQKTCFQYTQYLLFLSFNNFYFEKNLLLHYSGGAEKNLTHGKHEIKGEKKTAKIISKMKRRATPFENK